MSSFYLAYEPHDQPATLIDISGNVRGINWGDDWIYLNVSLETEPMTMVSRLREHSRSGDGWVIVYGERGNEAGSPYRSARFVVRREARGPVALGVTVALEKSGGIIYGTFGEGGSLVPED